MIETNLKNALGLWAGGDQEGALLLCQQVMREHPGVEQVALTYSGLLLHREDFEQAVAVLDDFLDQHSASPALLANLSIALRGLKQFERAAKIAEQVTTEAPQLVSGWNSFGLCLIELDQPERATQVFQEGLQHHPENPALSHHLHQLSKSPPKDKLSEALASPIEGLLKSAQTLSDEGNPVAAEAMIRKAIHFNPDFSYSHRALGCFLLRHARKSEGLEALEKAYALDPSCPTTQHFLQLARGEVPSRPSSEYVERLFDGYAERFDEHLVEHLDYQVPNMLAQLVGTGESGQNLGDVLDLGCGTGLMGEALKDQITHIDGVDLSQNMLDLAERRNIYRSLVRQDIEEYLRHSDQRWNLIICADVLVYMGDLRPIIDQIAKHLAPNGRLGFSVESTHTYPYTADSASGRYQHHTDYLRELLSKDFVTPVTRQAQLRKNSGLPVQGTLILAQRKSE